MVSKMCVHIRKLAASINYGYIIKEWTPDINGWQETATEKSAAFIKVQCDVYSQVTTLIVLISSAAITMANHTS